MIKKMIPLSMTESSEYITGESDREEEVRKFIKKFIKIKPEKAGKIRKRIESLGLMKVKPEHISKIIDILPENSESLNKIFTDVGLDEDETKKILDSVNEK